MCQKTKVIPLISNKTLAITLWYLQFNFFYLWVKSNIICFIQQLWVVCNYQIKRIYYIKERWYFYDSTQLLSINILRLLIIQSDTIYRYLCRMCGINRTVFNLVKKLDCPQSQTSFRSSIRQVKKKKSFSCQSKFNIQLSLVNDL